MATEADALLLKSMQAYHASHAEKTVLLWAGDSMTLSPQALSFLKNKLTLVGNRIDTMTVFKQAGFTTHFNDFSINSLSPFDTIYLPVCKERSVTHHCLNSSRENLAKLAIESKPGKLIIVGKKEEGIKSYAKHCEKSLKLSGKLDKHSNVYIGNYSATEAPYSHLPDQNYHELRVIETLTIADNNYTLYSKPGVYGWKKIDQGSAFLVETLLQYKQYYLAEKNHSALDLGCGSGYLTLALHALNYTKITATDNNAAAILATQKTCYENTIDASVIATDCADTLQDTFDIILCNPPFHKGFDVDKQLTHRFAKACLERLKHDGKALLVCNVFVGIEKEIVAAGGQYRHLAKNGSFKVVEVHHG